MSNKVESLLDRITIKPPEAKERKRREKPTVTVSPPEANLHFRSLGYNGDKFYFFTTAGKQVRELSASKLSRETELFTLAPMDWWEREFALDQGFSRQAVKMAANFLIQNCYQKGVFNADNKRGRGAWCDGESIIVHAGDRLFIDNRETDLVIADTDAVYECEPRIEITTDNPLTTDESKRVWDWAMSLNFEKQTHSVLLLGWLSCALAGGALNWRPHIFLNGSKGCGKSSILDTMLHLLGGFAIAAKGDTSAAGLRQVLQNSALPVLFDEAESDSIRAQAKMDDVLSLMRHASANLEARVIKGSSGGQASSYAVRSCFCLSAIRDPIKQAADMSRITTLSLKNSNYQSSEKQRTVTQPLADVICDKSFASRFRARVFSRLPQLLESIQLFTDALKETFPDSRMRDQIGALLGGMWVVIYDELPTHEQMNYYIQNLHWSDQHDIVESASDEQACLDAMLNTNVRVDGDEWRGDMSIGLLVEFVMSGGTSIGVPEKLRMTDAKRTLGMYGMKVEDQMIEGALSVTGRLLVANANGMLQRKVMAVTSWPSGWNKLLIRLQGAEKINKTVKIGGTACRCIAVPLTDDNQANDVCYQF
ncbi:hypothetical protein HUU62_08710 [Rhodoferax sp. 4810]|uniref:Uncharacterized protein n=1 Tax=Thiospirillum jenense TaxID=1653858 RepID=A0A839HDR4_9GAMM|nr:hypothetical protein [Thiospirillum jenense]MBB1074490.1 hypothetical protein [Rhodoferax jenense]MBB1125526.1 hypothetical protein [Thiospirillum jenense]